MDTQAPAARGEGTIIAFVRRGDMLDEIIEQNAKGWRLAHADPMLPDPNRPGMFVTMLEGVNVPPEDRWLLPDWRRTSPYVALTFVRPVEGAPD